MRKHPLALCEHCSLCKTGQFVPSKIIEGSEILFIGEAPGAHEVEQQEPFVGPSGQVLNRAIRLADEDPEAISKTNAVACRPPDNRTPTREEINACMPRLMWEIEQSGARKLVLLGKVARQAVMPVIGHSELADTASEGRGRWLEWNRERHKGEEPFDRRVLATWHPAYVLRQPDQMSTLVQDVAKAYTARATNIHQPPTIIVPEDRAELWDWLRRAPNDAPVAFDIETNQIMWYNRPGQGADPILMLGFCWDPGYSVVVKDELLYDDPGSREVLVDFWRTHTDMAAHNGKFDVTFLRAQLGLPARCDFDTMLAHYTLDENAKHGLKGLAAHEFDLPDYEKDMIARYLRNSNDEYSKIPFKELSTYMGWDVRVTLELRKIYEQRMKAKDTYEWPFKNVLMPGQEYLTDVSIRGFPIDVEYVKKAKEVLEEEEEQLTDELRVMAGDTKLNPNSPAQLAKIIYDKLNLTAPRSLRKVRESPRTTAKEVLAYMVDQHPFVALLQRYRKVMKMRSSYIENLLYYADCQGRVHPDFLVMGTEVGRLACRDPAAQTIPRGKERYGAMIKGAFIAEPGCDLVVVDFSQAELRVAAVLSGEPFLLDVYANDRDLHTEATIKMYGTPEDIARQRDVSLEEAHDIWDELRVRLKMFNFAYLYGGNEFSFSQDAGMPLALARQFVHDYEQAMPVLAAWKRKMLRLAMLRGYVESPFGRRRHFPLITEENRDEARKASVHAPVAGTASDLTLLAGKRLNDEGFHVHLLVHDSCIFSAPKEQSLEMAQYAAQVFKETGEEHLPQVAWKADYKISDRWAKPPQLIRVA